MASVGRVDISSTPVWRPHRGPKRKDKSMGALTWRFLVPLLNGLLAIGLMFFFSSGGLWQGQPQPEFLKPLGFFPPLSSVFFFGMQTIDRSSAVQDSQTSRNSSSSGAHWGIPSCCHSHHHHRHRLEVHPQNSFRPASSFVLFAEAVNSSRPGVVGDEQKSPAGVSTTTERQESDSRREGAFKHLKNKRKEAGMTDSSDLLYKDDVYRLHYSKVHPVVLEENADLMLREALYETFIDDLRRDPKATIYFSGYGSIFSENSVKTFCPEAETIGFGRIWGMKRMFSLPSFLVLKNGWGTAEEMNIAVLAVTPADDSKMKGPLVAIIKGTRDCLPKWLWRERFYDVVKQTAYLVDEKLSPTGKQYDCWMVKASSDQMLKRKFGYFHYLNIVDRAAQIPRKDFYTLLSEDTTKQVLDLSRSSRRSLPAVKMFLHICFFGLKRGDVYSILGNEDMSKMLESTGITSIWDNRKRMFPAIFYLRAVLCGALKHSRRMVADFAKTTYLNDGTTTIYTMMKESPERMVLPSNFAPPYEYADATSCTTEELQSAVDAFDD